MERNKYDVFISYRRVGGKEKARPLKSELEKRGYKVFLDFDDLKDSVFDKRIMDAIDEAPIFLIILSEHSLDRCKNDEDWVRKEIEYADMKNKHFIPVNPDREFKGFPDGTPESVRQCLGQHQFSSIDFEQLFIPSVNMMVKDRIEPIISSLKTVMNEKKGALIRIETDLDCRILCNKEELTVAKSGDITEIRLPKGKHKLTFEGIENKADYYSLIHEVKDVEYEDYIEVSLLEKYNARKEFEREKYNGHEYVDLGLSSGLKWATCNVGASSPEQYGNYYAWGDISSKEEYNSDNCLSYNNETLDLDDINGDDLYDVARKSWGSSWRMPTQDEYMELKDNCIWEWIDQDGRKGCRVTGPNGNSIFFPATGFYRGSSIEYKGVEGYYWSSTPNYDSWINDCVESTCSLYFNMYTNGVGYFKDRWYGQAVRPVSDKNFTM